MKNYFNYFTEIEDHFQRRRGSLLMLSTLDWALIETWREAGVPLEAVLRGIDAAFDRYDARKAKSRVRRINGLAWCSQEVMAAVEQMKEAAVGTSAAGGAQREAAQGFEAERIAAHLTACAKQLRAAASGDAGLTGLAGETALATALRLEEITGQFAVDSTGQRLTDSQRLTDPQRITDSRSAPRLEDLERNLTVMEEKLFAALTATAAETDLLAMREQAARELAPYRGRMQAVQIRLVEQQFLHKRLLEKYGLPRLSLFYLSQS